MQPDALPRKLTQLELRWWELPSYARWFIGSVTTAAAIGITGGLLA